MYVLGLYSDGNYFKVSLMVKKGKEIRIEFLKEFNKNITNLEVLKNNIDKKSTFFSNGVEVVTALPADEVFIKKIMIPLTREDQVYKALEQQLFVDESSEMADHFFIPLFEKKGDETEVTLYGYTRASMEKHHLLVKELGVLPEWITTISSALSRYVAFCKFPQSPYFLFHLGWENSSIHFFYEGAIVEEASFSLGFKDVIDAVQKDQLLIDSVDMDKVSEMFIRVLDEQKESAVRRCYVEFRKAILRIQTYIIEKDERAVGADNIVFTGYAEFSRAFKLHIDSINLKELVPSCDNYTPSQLCGYAIEIGLALDVMAGDAKSLQLGKGLFMPLVQRDRAKKHIKKFFLAASFSLAVLFFSVTAFFSTKERLLESRYKGAISTIEAFIGKKGAATNNNLRRNSIVLKKAIEKKKQKNKELLRPLSFFTISKWLATFLTEEFIIDEIKYLSFPSGGELFCFFEGVDRVERAQILKDSVTFKEYGFTLEGEIEVKEENTKVMVKMRVCT